MNNGIYSFKQWQSLKTSNNASKSNDLSALLISLCVLAALIIARWNGWL